MQEFKPIKEGKVREVYDNGESLIITATDRISAFDHILKNKITKIIIYNPQYLLFGVIISIRSELIISSIFAIIIISSASKYNEYLIVIIVFSPLEYILIFIFGTNPLFLIYLQFIICD